MFSARMMQRQVVSIRVYVVLLCKFQRECRFHLGLNGANPEQSVGPFDSRCPAIVRPLYVTFTSGVRCGRRVRMQGVEIGAAIGPALSLIHI